MRLFMKKKWWFTTCATMGPLGYMPISGTLASVLSLPLLLVKFYVNIRVEFGLLILATLAAYFIIDQAYDSFNEEDPSAIVLDEVVGVLWALWGIPLTWWRLLLGFILFRIFDITKFPLLNWLEKMPGALGIILDDVAAGIITNIILWVMIL